MKNDTSRRIALTACLLALGALGARAQTALDQMHGAKDRADAGDTQTTYDGRSRSGPGLAFGLTVSPASMAYHDSGLTTPAAGKPETDSKTVPAPESSAADDRSFSERHPRWSALGHILEIGFYVAFIGTLMHLLGKV